MPKKRKKKISDESRNALKEAQKAIAESRPPTMRMVCVHCRAERIIIGWAYDNDFNRIMNPEIIVECSKCKEDGGFQI